MSVEVLESRPSFLTTELALEIVSELLDPAYANRTHGRRSCASAGCTGPLCRKANRDRQRARYARQPGAATKLYGPRDPELDAFLERVISTHAQERSSLRSV